MHLLLDPSPSQAPSLPWALSCSNFPLTSDFVQVLECGWARAMWPWKKTLRKNLKIYFHQTHLPQSWSYLGWLNSIYCYQEVTKPDPDDAMVTLQKKAEWHSVATWPMTKYQISIGMLSDHFKMFFSIIIIIIIFLDFCDPKSKRATPTAIQNYSASLENPRVKNWTNTTRTHTQKNSQTVLNPYCLNL